MHYLFFIAPNVVDTACFCSYVKYHAILSFAIMAHWIFSLLHDFNAFIYWNASNFLRQITNNRKSSSYLTKNAQNIAKFNTTLIICVFDVCYHCIRHISAPLIIQSPRCINLCKKLISASVCWGANPKSTVCSGRGHLEDANSK